MKNRILSSDKDLFQKAIEGHESAFKQLFDQYYEPLCVYATAFVKDPETAKDIVEDFFIQFWLKISKLKIKTSLKSYLFRAVHNRCLNYLRDNKNHLNLIRLSDCPEVLNYSAGDYPFSNLVVQEIEEKIKSVLEDLPPKCRQVFKLRFEEQMTYSQIAHQLNLSLSTVKTQMSRAMGKFKEALGDHTYIMLILLLIQK